MSEIVYSTQRVKNLGGRKFFNPVHFVNPEEGAKTVYVQDGYTNVVDAYKRVPGVKILPLSDLPEGAPAAAAPSETKKEK